VFDERHDNDRYTPRTSRLQIFFSSKIISDAVQEVSDKSSRFIGNALGVAEELLNPLIRHLHEMVFIEPADILRRKMQCDSKDCLAWNLAGFSRMAV